MGEVAIAILLCNLLNGGETEVRHYFPNLGKDRYVRVDCETPTHVIEIGLDGKRSSRDSVHQALFAKHLTKKTPMVVIIDTDGVQGNFEYEMSVVTELSGVAFGRCKKHFIESWAASAGFRDVPDTATIGDLPMGDVATRHCDLAGQFELPSGGELLGALSSDKPPLFGEASVTVSLSN